MATTDVSEDVRWSIIVNCQHLSPKMLQLVIPHLLSPLPEEYLLINDSPCSYARVQEKVFQVLEKHGQIALLAKAENRPKFLYNISSEVLFDAIRRDKIYEMEPFVLSFIDRQTGVHQIHVRRMVVEAAWVLADLGNTEKAQDVISQVAESIDLSVSGSEWILGDILKGIHLLPSDYALHQIEKTWSSIQASDSVLSAHQCVEALEQIGTPEAIDMLARIAQEAVGQPRYILVPERALRAIQKVSPAGREDWLIRFLQQNDQDRGVVLRVIDMLGMTGNRQVLPMLQQYFENPPNERIRYFAFWAIHNIYKATNEVWYNSEESGCV
jgi:HEAT repeat protein